MSGRVAAIAGVGIAGYAAYAFTKPAAAAETAKLTPEQQKTRRIRSHLSGNHPGVSGGDDCLSRKSGNLKARGSSTGDAHDGEKDKRAALGGTVVVK